MVYRVLDAVGKLLSTQEARVALAIAKELRRKILMIMMMLMKTTMTIRMMKRGGG